MQDQHQEQIHQNPDREKEKTAEEAEEGLQELQTNHGPL